MATKPTLSDALRTQRVGPPDKPLLSEEEIRNAIRMAPAVPSAELPDLPQARNSSLSAWRWSVGATAALAAASLVVISLPDLRNAVNVKAPAATDFAQEPASSQPVGGPVRNDAVDAQASAEGAGRGSNLAVPDTSVAVRPMQLPASSLEQLQLSVSPSSITYNEDGQKVTVKTSGISARGSKARDAEHTPRHITLYRNGKAFASWFDSAAVRVNDLVPVRLHIEDPGNAMFPAADVILWYVPSEAFLATLPDAYRLALGKELKGADVSQGFLERHTQASLITGSRLYPNPVSGSTAALEMQFSSQCRTSARVLDVNGREVLTLWSAQTMPSGTTNSTIHELDALPNGMYLVVVSIDGTLDHIIQRLLIER